MGYIQSHFSLTEGTKTLTLKNSLFDLIQVFLNSECQIVFTPFLYHL